MKYQLSFIGLVFGVFVLWGCSAESTDINQADEVEAIEEAEQADKLNQVDEANEASEPAPTQETNQIEQADQVEEPTQADGTEQMNEAEVVDDAGQTEELAEVDDTDQANVTDAESEVNQAEEVTPVEESDQVEEVNEPVVDKTGLANVISVEARGNPGSYTFLVGISSPDEGCQQYADWWEVLNEDGELVYRRILLHSHVNEQPFVRSGGPVEIAADQVVWVRAHMNTSGYGVVVFQGSVENGFQEAELSLEFAIEAASLSPLPDGCAF